MPEPTPPSTRPTPSRGRLLAAPAVALVLVLGAAACSGSGAGSDGSGSSQGMADSGGGSAGTAEGGSVAAPAEGAEPAAVAAVGDAQRAVVSTGTLAVRVEDLPSATTAVEALTTGAGGSVAASQVGAAGEDQQAHLTLRVPSASFEDVQAGVAELGQQTDRSTTSTDVTAEVADVDSRVASAQAVLVTFRDRLPQARTIPDVLAIEGEIATRQADLEALQARQRVLADQVSLATLDVTLTQGAPTSIVAASDPGFRGGLGAGWHALGEFLRVASLVLGAVLPFVVPVAVVAVPVLLLRRRRTRTTAPAE
ncbi:DUF4349 domain-containing protein [Kineococcus sp. R86509]|uniref:DUF4349 domain-containing protein n=1 Tax=Kineococcus sp. R86509 TaxID=3093851 RepID=UPI0036D3696C